MLEMPAIYMVEEALDALKAHMTKLSEGASEETLRDIRYQFAMAWRFLYVMRDDVDNAHVKWVDQTREIERLKIALGEVPDPPVLRTPQSSPFSK